CASLFADFQNNLLCAFFFYFSFSLLFHALSEQHISGFFIGSKAMTRITDCLHHKNAIYFLSSSAVDIIKSIYLDFSHYSYSCKNIKSDSLYFNIETWLLNSLHLVLL
ncbi:hypothetical protein ACJX0J_030361, partial [Zea mays]